MTKKKNNRKTFKGWVQTLLSGIIALTIVWVGSTIETLERPLNECKTYLLITLVLIVLSVISGLLLSKYGKKVEE